MRLHPTNCVERYSCLDRRTFNAAISLLRRRMTPLRRLSDIEGGLFAPQQLRILTLLARGLDRNAMADAAQTTTHNVQYHLKIMFTAFGVSSSTGLVAEAKRLGVVDGE